MAENHKTDVVFGAQFEPDLFWERHSRKVAIAGLAALAVVGTVVLWNRRRTELAENASASLATANDPVALERVIQTYAGQPVVPVALLRLADLHFRAGQFAEAGAVYQRFLTQFPAHSLANLARLGTAGCQEAQGNFEGARALYDQLAASDTTGHIIFAAKTGAARCAEALGQTKQARQLYEEIMAMGQGGPWQSAAYVRWQTLAREEIAEATNAPATQPMPQPVATPPGQP